MVIYMIVSCCKPQIKEDVGDDVGMPQASTSYDIGISNAREHENHYTVGFAETDHHPSQE